MMFSRRGKGLGRYLLDKGLISKEQLQRALNYKKSNTGKKIGEILWEIDILGEEEVLKQLADYMGVECVILHQKVYPLMHQSMFSKKTMLDYVFAPFNLEGSELSVAISEINNFEMREKIENTVKCYTVKYYLSLPGLIKDFIRSSYAKSENFMEFRGRKEKFGEYLTKKGIVTEEELNEVLESQKKFSDKRLGELLCESRLLNSEQALKELAGHLGKEYETLVDREPQRGIKELFDVNFMIKRNFVPFAVEGPVVKVAMGNIFDFELIEMIENKLDRYGMETRFYLSLTEYIQGFLEKIKENV